MADTAEKTADTAEEKGSEQNKPESGSGAGADSGARAGSGFSRRVFMKGETLVKEGERGECAYVIKSGKVEIRKGARTPNPRVLNTLGAGNVVAEFALFDSLPHSADVIALEETETVALSRIEFETRVRTMDPVLRTAVMGLVAKARHMVMLAAEGGGSSHWGETPG